MGLKNNFQEIFLTRMIVKEKNQTRGNHFKSDCDRCKKIRTTKVRSNSRMTYLTLLIFTVLCQVTFVWGGQLPVISAYESVDGVLTKLNVPPNSDILLQANVPGSSDDQLDKVKDRDKVGLSDPGNHGHGHGRSSRYLLLKCTATYPIQWIYSGDGIPEFITNSTVNWETEPMVFMAAATLLKLSPHYTGNYSCRSIQNSELSKFYYLYISGESFFTSSTGGPITFSRHDSVVRIPCGVSNPRVRVTLQKLVDGYVSCLQVNDSLTYDGKSGFKLKLADLHQPEGEYLCIASYNGTFNFVQYNLILDPNRQQSLYLPQPTKQVSSSFSRIKCAAYRQVCGQNAYCTLDVNAEPVCKCARHHHGNPYQKCHPECLIDVDCPSNRICYNNACEDPCPTACGPSIELVKKCQVVNHKAICNYNSCNPSPCGVYSKCEDFNTRAICSCLPGYAGSPPYCSEPYPFTSTSKAVLPPEEQITGTRPNYEFLPIPESPSQGVGGDEQTQFTHKNHSSIGLGFPNGPIACRTRADCPSYLTCRMNLCENPCYPNPCGRNSNCQVQNYEAICSCAPGFIKVNQYCLPVNCRSDRDCPESKSCSRNKCVNPCNGYCSTNAVCAVKNHRPSCACLPGHSGNPFQGCSPASIKNTNTHGLAMPIGGGAYENDLLMTPESPVNPHGNPSSNEDSNPIFDRGPPTGDIPESPTSSKIQDQNRKPNQPQKQSFSTSTSFPVPTPGIVQPFKLCDPNSKRSKCGTNAKCQTTPSNHAYCQCSSGFTGDPYRFCYQTISLPNQPGNSIIIKDLPGNSGSHHDLDLDRDRETEAQLEASIESVINSNFGNLVTASGIKIPTTSAPASPSFIANNYYAHRKPAVLSTTAKPDSAVTPVIVCATNDECPESKMCITGSCFDPCALFHPVCGQNQECRVEKHRSVCVCKAGYPVRIANRCYRPGNYSSLSLCARSPSNPCGPNSICSQTENGISCRCTTGAEGEPPNCRPKNKGGKLGVKTEISVQESEDFLSVFGSTPSPKTSTYTPNSPCVDNYQCPELLGCVNNTCRNPCEGQCGALARCRVYQHTAKCFCPHGFYGNPRVRCNAPAFNSRTSDAHRTSLNSDSDSEPESKTGSSWEPDSNSKQDTDPALDLDLDLDSSPTTSRFFEVEVEANEGDSTSESGGEVGLKMEAREEGGESSTTNTNTNTNPSTSTISNQPTPSDHKPAKTKPKMDETPKKTPKGRNDRNNRNRTEKEKQDLARYEDEFFDDSNEFVFK